MHKNLFGIVFLALTVLSAGALAAEQSQSNLVVSRVAPVSGGVIVGFTTPPAGCTANYQGTHAFISDTQKEFNNMYAVVMEAKVTKEPVSIRYSLVGGCEAMNTLLNLVSVR